MKVHKTYDCTISKILVISYPFYYWQHGCIRRRSDVINTLSQSQGQSVEKSQLQQNMERAGLILRRNVPTDGDCLFHAVSDQLKRLKLQRYRHRQLRQMCVDQIRSHPIIV